MSCHWLQSSSGQTELRKDDLSFFTRWLGGEGEGCCYIFLACNLVHALVFAIPKVLYSMLARSLKAEVTAESLEGVEGTGAFFIQT